MKASIAFPLSCFVFINYKLSSSREDVFSDLTALLPTSCEEEFVFSGDVSGDVDFISHF